MKEAYGYRDPYQLPVSKGTKCTAEEGRTRQSEAASADINQIMKKYDMTGMLPPAREGFFADVSQMPTYQEALGHVARAREVFMQLPPEVRAVFGNDPAVLLDAWNAGEHGEAFERIGWLKRVQDPQLEKPPTKRVQDPQLEKPPTEAPGVKAPQKALEASKASA